MKYKVFALQTAPPQKKIKIFCWYFFQKLQGKKDDQHQKSFKFKGKPFLGLAQLPKIFISFYYKAIYLCTQLPCICFTKFSNHFIFYIFWEIHLVCWRCISFSLRQYQQQESVIKIYQTFYKVESFSFQHKIIFF